MPNSEQTSQAITAGSATSALTTSAVITMNNGDTVQGRLRNNTNVQGMNVYAARIDAIPAA